MASGEGSFPDFQKAAFSFSYHVMKSKLSPVTSDKGTNSTMRGPLSKFSSKPNYYPKAASSNTFALGLSLQHINFGWTQAFTPQQSTTMSRLSFGPNP